MPGWRSCDGSRRSRAGPIRIATRGWPSSRRSWPSTRTTWRAREALVTALADAYEPDRGRAVLDGWPGPESDRDARYWRLRGRWDLEYDHRPDRAVDAFRNAVAVLPQDWRSWFGLARALRRIDRDAEARQAAETVRRIREVLDPISLRPSLEAAFAHLDDPAALRDLAVLTGRVGLARLSDAWRTEAQAAADGSR